MRRFTRLTNAFSKKAENHMHAISLSFMFYNYCKIHKSLRITPAMASGITDHVWGLTDIVNLIPESEPKKRGPYAKSKKNLNMNTRETLRLLWSNFHNHKNVIFYV